MFGGLELKSKSGESSSAPAPAPAAASAFGFLNALSTPAADPAPNVTAAESTATATPAMSSFSFLQSSVSAPEPANVAPPAAAASSSAFSFMMQDPPAQASEPVPVASGPSSDLSGFSFLMPSPSLDAADGSGGTSVPPVVEDNASAAPASAPVPSSSGFSFLSSSIPEPEVHPAPTEITQEISYPSSVTRTVSSSSASSGVGGPATLTRVASNVSDTGTTPPVPMTASSSALPAGAGITFGTSSSRNVVKKKIRSHRVGSGAPPTSVVASPAPTAPPPASAATTAAPPTTTPASVPSHTDTASARDAAEEASRRAEAFMQAKAVEEAKMVSDAPPGPPAPSRSSRASSSSFGPPEIRPSASTDEVVAAAQAAAHEAKILQQQHQKGQGFMGTFFKGFRPSPTPAVTGSTGSSHGGTSNGVGADQAGMSRTISDRQMNQHHQTRARVDDDDDDDEVVVSTSVGGYTPTQLPPAPAPASSFTPITLPGVTTSTTSPRTTFAVASQTKHDVSASGVQDFKMSSSPAPTPRKMKTPIQVFEEYQAIFAQSVHRAVEQVDNVRSQQKMLREERFCAMAKDRLATQQIAQTESQLQVAVEAEDYELADQLGQVVEGHRREKQEVALMLENITKALAELNSQKTLVMKSVATCFDNLSVRLEELKEKEAATEQKDDAETFKQFSLISKQLSAEQERLQHDLKHLERDEHLVGEERKELEDAIKEQTGELEVQKDEVNTQLNEAQKEVEELRKRLELKQKEAADLRTKVYGLDDSISKVRVKFSRQLTRVDKKERALKESRNEWEMEDATHKRQKEAHELQVQSHSEALLVHDALMKTIEHELKLSKEFCEIIPTQLGFGDGDRSVEGEADNGDEGDMAQLQADVVTCEAAVGEARVILKVTSSALANLQAERDGLVKKIPELENQKKAAAANRDFKAASKASKEIKDATTRIKECEEEIEGEAMSKKQAAEEEMARLEEELLMSQELARAKEKIAGLQKMESLANRISQLIDKRKEICGDSSPEENTVRGVGALVLEGQIKALQMEGQDLGSKFGGWTELMQEMQIDVTKSTGDEGPEDGASDEKKENDGASVEKKENEAVSSKEATPEPVDDGLTSEERVARVRQLMAQISEAEKALEDAASREDFDEAVRLEEVFQLLQSEVEKINLTDEEAELAMQEAAPVNDSLPEEISSADEVSTPTKEATSNDDPTTEEQTSEDEDRADQMLEETVTAVPLSEDPASGENPTDDEDGKGQMLDEVVETEAQNISMDDTEAPQEEVASSEDPEEPAQNGDFEIAKQDETEVSTLNVEVGDSTEVDGHLEAAVEVEQNGEGSHLEGGNIKPEFEETTLEESPLE